MFSLSLLGSLWWALLVIAAAAYLLGSFCFAIPVSKLFAKRDIRAYGSGNAGATNMLRSLGKVPALLTTIGDLLKSFAAVAFGGWFLPFAAQSLMVSLSGEALLPVRLTGQYLAGLFCILGHLYPLYFGFRGGKGVIATLGMMLILDWRVALLCLLLFIVVVAVSRMVSLGSICAVATLPVLTGVFRAFIDHYAVGATLFSTGMALMIAVILIVKHIPNIRRIKEGTESRFGQKKSSPP